MRNRITAAQSTRIGELEHALGNRTLRTLLTETDSRLVRPDRLQRMLSGSARLSAEEARQLERVSRNRNPLSALKARGKDKQESKVNRALRDWINTGKAKGVDFKSQDSDTRQNQIKAIRALRYLGIDPSDGTFYVIGRKK